MSSPRILILADDLSGAAELAGIAAARGLTSEVQVEPSTDSLAEVIAIDTGTRSLAPAAAANKIRSVYERTKALGPQFVFKKTDSVLRGNIRVELEALADALQCRRILFIPANPGKRRCIREGRYYVQDRSLDQSVFATDPEYPQRSAEVTEALGPDGAMAVRSISREEQSPSAGLIIPDATSERDIRIRVEELNDQTLAAGAAEFFTACLDYRWHEASPPAKEKVPMLPRGPALFVCGSPAAQHRGTPQEAERHGVTVQSLDRSDLVMAVAIDCLRASSSVMVTLGDAKDSDRRKSLQTASAALLGPLIDVTVRVLDQTRIHKVFVEGGATAKALIERMGWSRFQMLPFDLLGVGCLRPLQHREAPLLFAKPGSYPWPKAVWQSL